MLGERLKALRETRGWSQSDLYRASGVAQGYISSIERGERLRVSGDVLQKLATALDTTVDALFNETPTEDLSQPPLELFRAAGWAEELIAAIVTSWPHQPAPTRSKILARAKQRAQEAQAVADARMADEDALRKEIGPLSLIF